jgi:hypothetical protein
MRKSWFAAAVCAATVASVGANAALAGEITGTGDPTGAPGHANSACAFSGLNDFDPAEGQNASRVQTAADSWKYYGLPKGAPGKLGLCRGGTN